MNFRVKNATPDDLDCLVNLNLVVQNLHVAAQPDFFKPVTPSECASAVSYFLKEHGCYTFLAQTGNLEGAGYVLLYERMRPENIYCRPYKYIEIDQICVHPGFRRVGVGKLLIKHSIQFARKLNYSSIHLSVWEFNEDARKSFKAYGFKDYYHKMLLNI